jgi:pyruvate/2-oxoglutarate dehydrogenase complex dihydrolipoamide dehydrogenase (E3) component
VGINEAEADKQGIPIQTLIKPLSEVDRAVVDGESEGLVKIHVKARPIVSLGPPSWPGTPEK